MEQRLSERAQFWLIVLLVYGLPIVGSLGALVAPISTDSVKLTDAVLWMTTGYELVVGSLVLGLLVRNGMAWRDLRPSGSWWQGILHAIVLYLLIVGCGWIVDSLLPQGAARYVETNAVGNLGIAAVIAVSIVNPLFEEGMHLGFVQERLRAHGAACAIGAALLLRILIHANQGLYVVLSILPLGLLFGFYTWRTGRVWPVILTHAALDLLGLIGLSGG